jgi:hypothetical protein
MSGEEVVREARLSRVLYIPAFLLLLISVALFVEAYADSPERQFALPAAEFFLGFAFLAAIPAFVRRRSTEILLRQVEGITVDQGLMGRIFNYGTIVVEGTGSDRTPYSGIGAPLKFRLAVQEQIDNSLAQRDGVGTPPPPKNDSYSELLKLNELREKGILTDEEFAREKRRVLGSA